MKNYKELFACADRLEKSIADGDSKIHLLSTRMGEFDGGASAGAFSDGSPYPAMLRAEANIDLGNYEKALIDAKYAFELCEKVQSTILGYEREECFITGLGFAGIAAAMHSDRVSASAILSQLKALPLGIFQYPMKSSMRELAVAKIHVALGEYREASSHLSDEWAGLRSLGRALRGSGTESTNMFAFYELPMHYLRGKCQLESGKIPEAKSAFEKLFAFPQVSENGEIYWMLLSDRGRIAEKEGKPEEAIEYYRKALDAIERQRSTINTEASKIGFAGDKQVVYAALTRLLLVRGDIAAAFEYAERAKARALVDMLAAKQDFAIRSGDPAKVKELLTRASQAETELMLQEGTSGKATQRSAMRHAQQQLKSESPELASLVSVSSLTAGEVQALIPADETLIEYYQNGTDLIAFVVTPRELKAVRLDGTALLESVRHFRERLEEVDTNNYLPLGTQLYDQLIRPLASELKSGKLAIVAHGPLHYLPFNALHDGQRFLIDQYDLRFLPSASVIKYIRTQPVAKPGEILALGNPDLGNPQWDLTNAQAEAIAIARGSSQSKVLLRKEASEMAFRQYGENFRYIHFATHGLFNPESPLKSALLLAKDATSDGQLTVDKLYSMKLDADLVTLSACETGIGKIANGDDVVGLSRGFLYAGSRSIVASLWKVDDQATSYLMTRFYDQLKRSNKEEALRQAQIETRKKYPHPYFWAAFQITGSPS